MICSTSDGEPLWVKLRPGNAAANSIGDHLEVIDAAVGTLPDIDAAGHREGDDKELVERPLAVAQRRSRRDSRSATSGSRSQRAARRRSKQRSAVWWASRAAGTTPPNAPGSANAAALRQQTSPISWTSQTGLSAHGWWCAASRGTPARSAACSKATTSATGGTCSDQQDDTARLDRLMRSHADAADAVRRLNDSGLARMAFTAWNANSAWAALCMVGLALVGWFQNACLDGALRRAAPKRLRSQLWHLPALVCTSARRTLGRLPEQHPGARALLAIAHPR